MTTEPEYGPKDLDLDTPSAARAYDYFLGGSHNFSADREFADQVRGLVPVAAQRGQMRRSCEATRLDRGPSVPQVVSDLRSRPRRRANASTLGVESRKSR